MKKSVKENILKFLQSNSGIFHGAALQRMEFKTRNNGLATGDNIKRRLNELVREGKIHVDYEKGNAIFSAGPIPPPKKQVVSFIETPDGRKAIVDYV